MLQEPKNRLSARHRRGDDKGRHQEDGCPAFNVGASANRSKTSKNSSTEVSKAKMKVFD